MHTETDPQPTGRVLAAQATDYAELSRDYAARGDGRRAVLAAWAGDLRTVQAMVCDDDAELAQLPAVAAAVETALLSRGTPADASLRDVVDAARQAMLAAFDDSVHEQLRERFGSLDHLDGVAAPGPGSANEAVAARLDGRGGEQLVGDLLTAAADCRAVARVMAQVGDEDERRRQEDAGDLACFEAYLVLASAATGDATLATAELRWDLAAAAAAVAAMGAAPGAARRNSMLSVLAPEEQYAFSALLGLAPPVRVTG